jgi:hypothetical protein
MLPLDIVRNNSSSSSTPRTSPPLHQTLASSTAGATPVSNTDVVVDRSNNQSESFDGDADEHVISQLRRLERLQSVISKEEMTNRFADLWNEVERSKKRIGSVAFKAALRIITNAGDYFRAARLYNKMKEIGFADDAKTFTCLFKVSRHERMKFTLII